MDKKTLVEFVHKVPPYRAGERAGFDDPEARRFIALGAAREVAPPQAEKPAMESGEYATSAVHEPPATTDMRPKRRGGKA